MALIAPFETAERIGDPGRTSIEGGSADVEPVTSSESRQGRGGNAKTLAVLAWRTGFSRGPSIATGMLRKPMQSGR
jgi:hypothetical protein